MFTKGDQVLIVTEGLEITRGIILQQNADETYRVSTDGAEVDVSAFDLLYDEDPDDFYVYGEEDYEDDFEDLAPYRNLNQNYY